MSAPWQVAFPEVDQEARSDWFDHRHPTLHDEAPDPADHLDLEARHARR